MSSPQQVLAGIDAARGAVKQANASWEPASLNQVRAALRDLEASLPHLKASFEEIPLAGPLPVAKLRQAVQALRDEAAALEFLVDAAAAFVRNSPTAGAATGPGYGPAGEVRLGVREGGEVYSG